MRIRKGKNSPKLNEIIAAFSADLDNQLSKISGFD